MTGGRCRRKWIVGWANKRNPGFKIETWGTHDVQLDAGLNPDRRSARRNPAQFGGTGFGVGGGTEHRGAAFEYHAYRHIDEKLTEPPFVGESLDERSILELFEDARRNAAADVKSADRQD